MASTVNWRPYWTTAVILALALALNLWTHNSLWFWYTLVGIGFFLMFVGAVRNLGWRPPNSAAWVVGATAALHFVGGSLSGLHQIGGPNGLYFAFPWWDNVVHVLGSGAITCLAIAGLQKRVPQVFLRGFLAVGVATLAGVLVELYEFAGFLFFGTVDQGFYSNNTLDLYYNLIGAIFSAVSYLRWETAQAPGGDPSLNRGRRRKNVPTPPETPT